MFGFGDIKEDHDACGDFPLRISNGRRICQYDAVVIFGSTNDEFAAVLLPMQDGARQGNLVF